MVSIDGNEIDGATIDGTDVSEITMDGDTVWTAIPDGIDSHWAMDEGSGSSLSDDIGDIDGTLRGASWDTDDHFGDITTYDGNDNDAYSDDEFYINDENASLALWWRYHSIGADPARVVQVIDDIYQERNANDRWELIFDGDGELVVILAKDHDFETAISGIDVSKDTWYFSAIALDGDNVSFYMWDRDGELYDESGSEPRGTGDKRIMLMAVPQHDRFTEGDVAEVYMSDETVSKSDFEQIWEYTN